MMEKCTCGHIIDSYGCRNIDCTVVSGDKVMTQSQLDQVLKLVQAALNTERLVKAWADHTMLTSDREVHLAGSRLELFRAAEEVWKMVSDTDAALVIKNERND